MKVPEPHSTEWYALEEEALSRARELLHEHDGRIHEALYYLKQELREQYEDRFTERVIETERIHDAARRVAQKMEQHVEQCWATAILA